MTGLAGFGAGLASVAAVGEKFVDMIGGPENAVKLFAASLVAAKIAPFIGVLTGLGKGLGFVATDALKLGPVMKPQE